ADGYLVRAFVPRRRLFQLLPGSVAELLCDACRLSLRCRLPRPIPGRLLRTRMPWTLLELLGRTLLDRTRVPCVILQRSLPRCGEWSRRAAASAGRRGAALVQWCAGAAAAGQSAPERCGARAARALRFVRRP